MAYEKTTWETGDVITAAKLNNIEDGIAAINGVLPIFLTISGETAAFTATWQDIADAFDNATPVYVFLQAEDRVLCGIIFNAYYDPGHDCYVANLFDYSSQSIADYTCPTADDFPSVTMG